MTSVATRRCNVVSSLIFIWPHDNKHMSWQFLGMPKLAKAKCKRSFAWNSAMFVLETSFRAYLWIISKNSGNSHMQFDNCNHIFYSMDEPLRKRFQNSVVPWSWTSNGSTLLTVPSNGVVDCYRGICGHLITMPDNPTDNCGLIGGAGVSSTIPLRSLDRFTDTHFYTFYPGP